MSVLKRLLPYILLNILVSALVTWAVLTWWNSSPHPASPEASTGLPSLAQAQTTAPKPGSNNALTQATPTHSTPVPVQPSTTPQPVTAKLIEIAEVVGAGNLGSEVILLRRVGEGELRLFGWKLDDEAGHRYTFPDMVLYKNGAVRLNTRTGANTVNELFWGLKDAVWISGKTATLSDDRGNLRASLIIP